jgi:hypothetical protein
MTDTPAPGQEADDDLTAILVAEKYPVYLRKPSDGQMAALVMLSGLDAEDSFQLIASNMVGLSEVMDSLCVDPADTGDDDATTIRHLYKLMCRGEIDLEDFIAPAVGLAQRWGNGDQIEENRADRRRAKKTPVKAAVARPSRARAR